MAGLTVNELNQLLTLGTLIIIIVSATNFGVGTMHVYDLTENQITKAMQLNLMFDIFFSQSACQTKLAVLWFSKRLIGKAYKGVFYPHFIALVVLFVIVAVCEVLFIIVSLVLCRYASQSSLRQRTSKTFHDRER